MESNLLYRLYEKHLSSHFEPESIPRHIGVILDGNRRWARLTGTTPSHGHRAGASRIAQLLEWSDEVGVEIVTLWMLSTDNLARDEGELGELCEIIGQTVMGLASVGKWKIGIVGDMSLLPTSLREQLNDAVTRTSGLDGMTVNIAVGYGGRHEIVEAVRSLLSQAAQDGMSIEKVAQKLSIEDITDHIYTKGQPDPDLVIRTSGEQRLSGFMLWQSVHTEFYFCDVYWPDFRRVDFLRALRSYAQRERRRGR